MNSKSSNRICSAICPINGFTLIELMMTLAIAAIVLSIAVPSFQESIRSNRKTTAINDLQTSLALARSTAITQRVTTTVCKSSNASSNSVNPTCNNGGDWSQGWMVFSDPNNQGTWDNGETIHRVHDALPLSANGSFIGNGSTANRVSFTPQGMSSGTLGTITYSDGSNNTGSLVISFGGQVRYEEFVTNGS